MRPWRPHKGPGPRRRRALQRQEGFHLPSSGAALKGGRYVGGKNGSARGGGATTGNASQNCSARSALGVGGELDSLTEERRLGLEGGVSLHNSPGRLGFAAAYPGVSSTRNISAYRREASCGLFLKARLTAHHANHRVSQTGPRKRIHVETSTDQQKPQMATGKTKSSSCAPACQRR